MVDDTRLELAAGLSLRDYHPAPYPLAAQAQTKVTSSARIQQKEKTCNR